MATGPGCRMVDFTGKLSYTQSYPHYPQKLDVEYQIYIKWKETNVLVNNNENKKMTKKIINPIDIYIQSDYSNR